MAKTTDFVFPDDDKIRDYVAQIDDKLEEIATLRGEYMQRCRSIREQISEVYDAAADAGLPKRSLKRAYNRKLLRAKLETEMLALEDEPDLLADMVKIESAMLAFETTPLGKAGKKRAA